MSVDNIEAFPYLSREDFNLIAKRSLQTSNFVIENFELHRINDKSVVGFIGEYYKLLICVRMENSKSMKLGYFVKTAPTQNEHKKAIVKQYFEKESRVYSELFGLFDKNVKQNWWPKCYLARDDCLVLEDLTERCYRNICLYEFEFGVPHIKCILHSLAEMHSQSFILEAKGISIATDFGNLFCETKVLSDNAWFNYEMEAIKYVILHSKVFKKYHNSVRKSYHQWAPYIVDMFQSSTTYRNVFSHGDLWASNIMFKHSPGIDSPEHAVLLDFQLCRYLPPAVDVLVCIFLNTRRDHRNRHLEYYLRYYWDCLQTQLSSQSLNALEILSWLDFRNSCHHYEFLAIVSNCRYAPFSNLKPGTLQSLESNDMERYSRVCSVDRGQYIVENLKMDKHFRDVVLESLQELVEKLSLISNK